MAGGSNSPSNSSTHCHGEPDSPILAPVTIAQCSSLGLALSRVGVGGATGPVGGIAWPMGVARDCRKGAQPQGAGSGPRFSSAFFPWRQGKQSWAAGGPEVHNVLLKKVRPQLAGSIRLGLVGVPAHSSPSQVFQQAGCVRPPSLSPFPFSLMVTSK